MLKIGYIVIDCKEPATLAKFWEEVLAGKVTFADVTGAMLELKRLVEKELKLGNLQTQQQHG